MLNIYIWRNINNNHGDRWLLSKTKQEGQNNKVAGEPQKYLTACALLVRVSRGVNHCGKQHIKPGTMVCARNPSTVGV